MIQGKRGFLPGHFRVPLTRLRAISTHALRIEMANSVEESLHAELIVPFLVLHKNQCSNVNSIYGHGGLDYWSAIIIMPTIIAN